jgi:hypothetical protein
MPTNEVSKRVFVSKWGCDRTSGQSQYKQNATDQGFSDNNLFLTSMLPLQLYASKE